MCGTGSRTWYKVEACSDARLRRKGVVVTGAFYYAGSHREHAGTWVPYAVVETNTGQAALSRHLLEQFASGWISQATKYDPYCGGHKMRSPLTVLPPSRAL